MIQRRGEYFTFFIRLGYWIELPVVGGAFSGKWFIKCCYLEYNMNAGTPVQAFMSYGFQFRYRSLDPSSTLSHLACAS